MKHLISKEGFEKLKAEWEHLKYEERPAMINQVQAAAAEGDRSENAAYTYGRMRVREIDRRLRELDHPGRRKDCRKRRSRRRFHQVRCDNQNGGHQDKTRKDIQHRR